MGVMRMGSGLKLVLALLSLVQIRECTIVTIPQDGAVRLPEQGKIISLKCQDPDSTSTPFRWFQVSQEQEEIELVGGETGDLSLEAELVADGDLLRCKDDKENKADFRIIGQRNVELFGIEPLPKTMNVLDNRSLNLTCNVVNRSSDLDDLHIQWFYWDIVDDADFTQDSTNCSISGDKWILVTDKPVNEEGSEPELSLGSSGDIEGSVLRIVNANKLHRRGYKCVVALKNMDDSIAPKCVTTFVKVKDTLAALWPFLGIVVEVVVLCAIIFMFERHVFVDDDNEDDLNSKVKSSPSKNGKSSLKQRKNEAKTNT